jgi:hypothetical protein
VSLPVIILLLLVVAIVLMFFFWDLWRAAKHRKRERLNQVFCPACAARAFHRAAQMRMVYELRGNQVCAACGQAFCVEFEPKEGAV